ncbi:MAG: histidinol dehydrogenase, partial [Anaerolineae bacterium]
MTRSLIPIITDIGQARQTVLRRAAWDDQEVPDVVRAGIRRRFGEELTPAAAVARVLSDVRRRGETAALEWTQRIDGVTLASLTVSRAEQQAALARLPAALVEALQLARDRIEAFHRKQPMDSWVDAGADGVLGQLVRPLDAVGVYVPGGTAPLPSSLLMAAVPARVA